MSSHDDMIKQFTEATGCDAERARFFLESSGWEIGPAMNTYLETEEFDQEMNFEDQPPGFGAPRDQEFGQNPLLNRSHGIPFPNPLDREFGRSGDSDFSAMGSQPVAAAARTDKKKTTQSTGSRIATLGSLRSAEESDDDSDDPDKERDVGQGLYVGSGQQVLGPGRKANAGEFVSSLFQSARQHGAESVENESGSSQPPRRVAFGGMGMRLDDDAPLGRDAVPLSHASGSQLPAASSAPVILRMWQNGFTINDEPLRLYSDPANRKFMEHIKEGRVPPELYIAARGADLKVQMEDHHHEEYKPPKPTVNYFSGAGHVLGSPAPNVVIKSNTGKPAGSVEDRKTSEEKAKAAFTPTTASTTNIQIRLADGSRLVHRFDENSTVGDVRRFIQIARPEYENSTFQMLAGFPSKPLTNDSASLKDANLLNAAIQVN